MSSPLQESSFFIVILWGFSLYCRLNLCKPASRLLKWQIIASLEGFNCYLLKSLLPQRLQDKMKTSDIGVTVVVYAFATWFLLMTLALPPAAQVYPLILIVTLYITNTLFIGSRLFQWLRTHQVEHDLPVIFKGFLWKQFATVFVGCVLYLAALNYLGYYLSSVVYLVLAQFSLKVKPVPAIISCTCIMIVTYLVFSLFLKVPLPLGVFFGG